jgi:predicted Rossmann fold nucleotide-binding protein DprA/Smf involved in DNA uptake
MSVVKKPLSDFILSHNKKVITVKKTTVTPEAEEIRQLHFNTIAEMITKDITEALSNTQNLLDCERLYLPAASRELSLNPWAYEFGLQIQEILKKILFADIDGWVVVLECSGGTSYSMYLRKWK